MQKRTILTVVIGIFLFAFSVNVSSKVHAAVASAVVKNGMGASETREQLHYVRGGNRGGRRSSRGGNSNRNVNRNRNSNRNVNRNRNTNRNVNVNRNTNRNVNVNVNVRRRGYGWRGTRWGFVAFGVTLGTTIIVVANTPPPPPHVTLCWTWSNAALTNGYWYYCSGP